MYNENKLLLNSFFQAAEGNDIILAIPGLKPHFRGTVGQYKADGVTENLQMKKFQSTTHVQEFLSSNIRLFIEDGNSSLIAFLYSVMISRGLAKLKSKFVPRPAGYIEKLG